MSYLLIWRLLGKLHGIHHRVVLQGETLLQGEWGAPMYACEPWYCLAVLDRTMVN